MKQASTFDILNEAINQTFKISAKTEVDHCCLKTTKISTNFFVIHANSILNALQCHLILYYHVNKVSVIC